MAVVAGDQRRRRVRMPVPATVTLALMANMLLGAAVITGALSYGPTVG